MFIHSLNDSHSCQTPVMAQTTDEHNMPTQTTWKALEYIDSIRLLTLRPAKARKSALHGELQLTTLSAYEQDILNPYTAISYVWGDPEHVDEVWLGQTSVGITANLGEILRDIRDVNKSLTIWVDALCINQDDILERNQQVRVMGEIYRQASSTIIYLRPTSQDIDFLFDILIGHQRQDPVNYKQSFPRNGVKWSLEEMPRLASALDDLCSREWFTRSWVFQELVLSKHPRIQCSRRRLQWDTLMPLIQKYSDKKGSCRLALAMHKARGNLNRLSFYNLLISRTHSKATDPRDFFYSIIGLANDRQLVERIVLVDYNIPPKDVYVRAARYLLRSPSNSITLASYCNLSALSKGLPSWVPDWGVQTEWPLQPHIWTTDHPVNDVTLRLGGNHHIIEGIGDDFFSSSDIPPSLRDQARLLKPILDGMTPFSSPFVPKPVLDRQITDFLRSWDSFVGPNVRMNVFPEESEIQRCWPQSAALLESYTGRVPRILRVICEYVDQFSHYNVGYGVKRLGRLKAEPLLLSSETKVGDSLTFTGDGFFVVRAANGKSRMDHVQKVEPRFLTASEAYFVNDRLKRAYADLMYQHFKIIEMLESCWWELPQAYKTPSILMMLLFIC